MGARDERAPPVIIILRLFCAATSFVRLPHLAAALPM
jgi:hypothetical protein